MRAIINDELKELTPELLAELFCDLDSEKQARFFNHISEVATTGDWWLGMQLQYVTDEDGLTLAGRRVMQEIGDYSHWGLCDFKPNGLGMRKQK